MLRTQILNNLYLPQWQVLLPVQTQLKAPFLTTSNWKGIQREFSIFQIWIEISNSFLWFVQLLLLNKNDTYYIYPAKALTWLHICTSPPEPWLITNKSDIHTLHVHRESHISCLYGKLSRDIWKVREQNTLLLDWLWATWIILLFASMHSKKSYGRC